MITKFVQSFIYLYLFKKFKNLKLNNLIINILCFKDQRFLTDQRQSKTFLIDDNISYQDKNV